MALKATEQLFEHLKRSKHPLICVPAGRDVDAFASAAGLARLLKKLDCRSTIVSADPNIPETVRFLDGHERIRSSLEHIQQFVIQINAQDTPVDELSYEMRDGKLFIHLSPKTGNWSQEDVKLTSRGYRHDLIICLGAADLEACDRLFEQHPDFFFETPIVNIDHTPENEHFGELNLVDLTAAAIGEICHDLVDAFEPSLFDEHVATAFLTGMIAKTKSFKDTNVTPKALQTASKLIDHGADRERIVQHLYRRRSVPTLRLWGRALARLRADEDIDMVRTMLSRQDFMHAGADEKDLPDVIEELIASSPQARIVLLLFEGKNDDVCGIVHTQRPLNALQIAASFNPSGSRKEARFTVADTSMNKAKEIISKIKLAAREQA